MEDIIIIRKKDSCEIFYKGSIVTINYNESPEIKNMTDEEIVKYYENGFKF